MGGKGFFDRVVDWFNKPKLSREERAELDRIEREAFLDSERVRARERGKSYGR